MWDTLFSKLKSGYNIGKSYLKDIRNFGGKVLRHIRSEPAKQIVNAVSNYVPQVKDIYNKVNTYGSTVVDGLNKGYNFINKTENAYNKVMNGKTKRRESTLERQPKQITKDEDYLGF
jgi:hypothetical protein